MDNFLSLSDDLWIHRLRPFRQCGGPCDGRRQLSDAGIALKAKIMADPRIIAITLDEGTILRRSAAIESEKRVAIDDLIEANRFAPALRLGAGYAGPFRVHLRVEEGRLAIDMAREDGAPLETLVLGLARFRRPVRDYFAICESYDQAVRGGGGADAVETIDMARRGLHNDGATMLMDRLEGKIAVDFDTARRLFTLLCILHIRT